jgi:hypothetical protein
MDCAFAFDYFSPGAVPLLLLPRRRRRCCCCCCLRRMPGYPRMDMGNPYLTARYDGRIVDSLPWGRGWLADGSMVGLRIARRV